MAIVWRPGQVTRIHDHVTWCVFGVIQGVEDEELFALDDGGECLVPVGRNRNTTGDVGGFAPPGDIHRVRNAGDPHRHLDPRLRDRPLPDRLRRPAVLRPPSATRLRTPGRSWRRETEGIQIDHVSIY